MSVSDIFPPSALWHDPQTIAATRQPAHCSTPRRHRDCVPAARPLIRRNLIHRNLIHRNLIHRNLIHRNLIRCNLIRCKRKDHAACSSASSFPSATMAG
jgi:hypothetical protein